MYNWSVDTTELEKDSEQYVVWRLEQMINYGEPGEKLAEQEVRKYWNNIRHKLDPHYRAYLEFLLWPKKKVRAS